MSMPSLSLEGKVAIITGAKRGLGKAIALTFAEAGANVAICTRVVAGGELDAVAEEIRKLGRRSLAIQADTTVKADVDNMVQRVVDEFGGIDILVNNAGIAYGKAGPRPLIETPEEDWDRVNDVNLKGYYLCCQAAGKRMVERKRGNIINVASDCAFKAFPMISPYCCSKIGVLMLTKVLAKELGPYNIRVHTLAPGWIRTEMAVPFLAKKNMNEIPLGRVGEPSELAAVALFLASDLSSFMTGFPVIVDGGHTLCKLTAEW